MATGTTLCPVRAMKAYVKVLKAHPSQSPPFCFANGSPLSRQKLSTILRTLLHRAKLPAERFNMHSLWIVAATAADKAGIPNWAIKNLGRWRSNTFQRYIRQASRTKICPSNEKGMIAPQPPNWTLLTSSTYRVTLWFWNSFTYASKKTKLFHTCKQTYQQSNKSQGHIH